MNKVLIITYYWPPAGGISVQRCLKFAKYLNKFGWEVVVYKPSNANYPNYDYNNLNDIPKEITILEHPIKEPFSLFKKLTGRKKNESANPVYARDKKVPFLDDLSIWIRGNFFIPDARSLWIKPSISYLREYLKKNNVNVLLTDGPPHTNTVIACNLAKQFNIPWLADFQDPWTQVDYYKMFKISRWADKKHKYLEQEVFNTAKKITIASPSWAKDLEMIGANNVDVIYWGYDEDDFTGLKRVADKRFSIFHGGVLGFDRNPEMLFKVLKDLKNEIPGFSSDLEIKLAGNIDFYVIDTLKKEGLFENLNLMGFLKRTDVLKHTINSHILLLPINKASNAKGRIPGKLFELLRTGLPILGLGTIGSDVENIIKKCNAGSYYDYGDYEGLKSYIIELYGKYKTDDYQNCTSNNLNVIEYSVENQIKKLSAYLKSISGEK